MDKITFIKELKETDGNYYERTLERTFFSAFVSCLSPLDACQLLIWATENNNSKRIAVLRKIKRDIEKDFQECHTELCHNLLNLLEHTPYNKKQTFAYCLHYFITVVPNNLQENIINTFLESPYKNIRNRAYNFLKDNWDLKYSNAIKNVWIKYHDKGCAKIIVEQFPVEYLKNHIEFLSFRAYLVKLFLRLGEKNKSILKKLSEVDSITYLYVLTKLGEKISAKEAINIFENNKNDERIGLVIWCIGQQGLWDVLIKLKNKYNKRVEWAESITETYH